MASNRSRTFDRKSERHVLILAKGDQVKYTTMHPWLAAFGLTTVALLSMLYLGATAYLVLRDDLVGAAMNRQARMQHDYEDRISALRAQVDRITSRQLLDQQVVEAKVEKLIEQQLALTSRQGKLGSALERAEDAGLSAPEELPDANLFEEHSEAQPLEQQKTRSLAYATGKQGETMADRADKLFSNVTLSLKDVERRQLTHIENLTANASSRADEIQAIVRNTGLKLPQNTALADSDQDSAIGGPYLAPEPSDRFESSLMELDLALDKFERARNLALKLPFANPAPGREITSLFGNRLDPFFARLAMHAGVDFRQMTGGNVYATGAGTVVSAEMVGGYGNMVEIDHGNGVTTRYGHLSRILVNAGDKIDEGQIIALSGSTGRSTGPHLHYEVRLNGAAVDPMRFLNAGMKLTSFIR